VGAHRSFGGGTAAAPTEQQPPACPNNAARHLRKPEPGSVAGRAVRPPSPSKVRPMLVFRASSFRSLAKEGARDPRRTIPHTQNVGTSHTRTDQYALPTCAARFSLYSLPSLPRVPPPNNEASRRRRRHIRQPPSPCMHPRQRTFRIEPGTWPFATRGARRSAVVACGPFVPHPFSHPAWLLATLAPVPSSGLCRRSSSTGSTTSSSSSCKRAAFRG
jgi:hypothetical protein